MIKLNNVTKTLKGHDVVKDVSLSFEKGKIYLLRGHNGCGKTMLLRLLCGLITPTIGSIEKDEYTYGVIIETPAFVEHETARQNLKFLASIQKKIDMKDIENSVAKVNLSDVIDKQVKKYSLGMKQRLSFCQAIMEDPDVLLLDEPFNALDTEHFELLVGMISKMKEGKIIVIAAHGIDVEKHSIFDQIVTLCNGKIESIEDCLRHLRD
ncbi:MAG: ABC transporter ATP-binding protein [Oscillospiraceae bacterium]|nr:ABC transporter ATP-binding protein [Oscillospiraceae bacterium]